MRSFKSEDFSSLPLIGRPISLLIGRTLLWLIITILITLRSQLAFGSALSDLAASMQPGSWLALSTTNFNDGAILRPPNTGSVLEYTDKAGLWNPLNNTILLLGSSHPNSGAELQCGSDMF